SFYFSFLYLVLIPVIGSGLVFVLLVCVFIWEERNLFCFRASLTFSLFSRILNENNASHRGID
ncbi:unnamed protein product, partial [Brassica rapa subsp. trilocularis]